jgi:glycosyltransferase involved in cell wall biosynthesis
MDICVLNPFFYPYKGGTEKALHEIYTRLAKRNNVTVITSSSPGKGGGVEEIDGIKVVRLKSRHIEIPVAPLPFVAMDGLSEAIKKENCDLYHINNRYHYFYDSVLAVRKVRGKIALTIHNSLPIGIDPVIDSLGRAYDMMWGRMLMHEADLITGVSKSAIDMTVPRKEHWKTHVVYNGVDYRLFRPIDKTERCIKDVINGFERSFRSNDANVITNGRLVEQKGQTYLIKAVAELNDEGHRLGLLIVGRGPMEKELMQEAHELGLKNRFWIRNGIEENHLPYYYNACDIFMIPSLYEPAALVMLEAMACCMPSIASRVGGLPEMMDGCGLYVKPRNVKEIKDRIRYALDNKKKMEYLAKKGRELAISKHDWDDISKTYEKLFLDTIHY